MSKIAKESIFQLLPRNACFYLTANLKMPPPPPAPALGIPHYLLSFCGVSVDFFWNCILQ